jgi:hypothetical protein
LNIRRNSRPAFVFCTLLSLKLRRKLAYGASPLPFVTNVTGQAGPIGIPVDVLLTT